MKTEQAIEAPDWVYIEASLEGFSIGDKFGDQVTCLISELKGRDANSVWAKRLALYEVARRNAWLRSFRSLDDLGIDGLLLERFTLHAIQRLTNPAKIVRWEDLGQEILNKRVIFEHGSYANVPTMAHVGYVNYGAVGPVGIDTNVLSLDSAKSIKGLKGKEKIVLDDDVRTALWQHVPGIDVVTVAPDFDTKNPRKFWVEETYPKLAKQVSNLTLMCSYGDQVANEKMEYARLVRKIDVRVAYRDSWHSEFGHSLFPHWTTTQWDSISEDHHKFEDLARQYLVS